LEYSAGKYVSAADAFATVVSLDSDNPWSRCYYGYSLGKAGRIDAAVAMLEESVRRFPDNQQLRFLLGLGYYHKGSFFKAVKEMARARDAIMDF
jgi:predicted Zn-dependent protease